MACLARACRRPHWRNICPCWATPRPSKPLSPGTGTIKVPTLYIWGDADATVGPDAAYGTGEFIGAAYAMEVLPSVGHFVMDQAPAKATDLMLAHLKKHPV